jgi:hypothetical protein
MPGAASAGGRTAIAEWMLERLGVLSESNLAALGLMLKRHGVLSESDLATLGLLKRDRFSTGLPLSDIDRSLDPYDLYDPYVYDSLKRLSRRDIEQITERLYERRASDKISKQVSSLYNEASPNILNDLTESTGPTNEQILSIINNNLKKVIENTAKDKDSGLTFEPLTGKVKIGVSYKGRLGKVTVGEINVYKVSAIVAASVYVCAEAPGYRECVEDALDKVKTAVSKELKKELKQESASKEGESTSASARPGATFWLTDRDLRR